jgi:hypothetical protein
MPAPILPKGPTQMVKSETGTIPKIVLYKLKVFYYTY